MAGAPFGIMPASGVDAESGVHLGAHSYIIALDGHSMHRWMARMIMARICRALDHVYGLSLVEEDITCERL